MTTNEIIATINELQEMEALLEEVKNEVDTLRDSLKLEMVERNAEELEVGSHIIRFTSVTSNRLDSTALKRTLPHVYQDFLKQISSKRFSIS